MAQTFSLSPAVTFNEVDLSSIIPAVSTSNGCTVGQFLWGPAYAITVVDSEQDLVNQFGATSNSVYVDFMVAASFLAYASNLQMVRVVDPATALNASATATAGGTGIYVPNSARYQATSFGSNSNLFVAKWPGAFGNSIGVAYANSVGWNDTDSNSNPLWNWNAEFPSVPAANEYHIVVYDAGGIITGTVGTILEKYAFTSVLSNAVSFDGSSGYFVNQINKGSQYIWIGNPAKLDITNSLSPAYENGVQLAGGADGTAISEGQRQNGFAMFLDSEAIDINLVFTAGAGLSTMQYVIQDLVEVRRDCIALVSPLITDVVNIFNDGTAVTNMTSTRNSLGSSSYAVMDSCWKLMYDRYADVNRWVPLNGDIAGLCAQTDAIAAVWYSPAGLNRGNIKNCIALSNGLSKTFRDIVYPIGINPCVLFPTDGPVLFGDKTLQSRPSAFDRINVRRLFIYLEKALSTAAKFYLFEFNDAITQLQFRNQATAFLKTVQAGRGITRFAAICDSSNNTDDVVNSNEFVANIIVQPNYSINFINLTFTCVNGVATFSEVVQQAPASQ